MIRFKVNGVERSFSGDPEMPVLWYLRDILGLTGTKFGCGVALCGACTVLQNRDAVRSCVVPMRDVAGKEITTIEGRNEGDVDAAFAKGVKIVDADYYVPLLAHAAMEPVVAVAEFKDGKVTAWAPTQNPQAAQDIISRELGILSEDVVCHVTLLGGAFGRKSKPDYVAEAAVLSKKVGRPVKVVWTREDDIKFDYYNAVAAMYMKAALDSRGKPTAWLQRSVFPPITSIFDVNAVYGDPAHLGQGWTDIPYDIPNLRVENGPARAHVRIGWLRSVANIYHGFAVQCFSDELSHTAGRDPLDYLLELIGPPRILNLKNTDYPNYGAPYDARELDERLGLRELIEQHLTDSRRGKNTQFPLADLLRQSVYSRLAGYEDLSDAERLSQDPTFG